MRTWSGMGRGSYHDPDSLCYATGVRERKLTEEVRR
jgi:hypothetical protein